MYQWSAGLVFSAVASPLSVPTMWRGPAHRRGVNKLGGQQHWPAAASCFSPQTDPLSPLSLRHFTQVSWIGYMSNGVIFIISGQQTGPESVGGLSRAQLPRACLWSQPWWRDEGHRAITQSHDVSPVMGCSQSSPQQAAAITQELRWCDLQSKSVGTTCGGDVAVELR